MPSKKPRARGSSQSSSQTQRQTRSVSREPSMEPQRQTRAGRKRRLSNNSNASDQPANSQATATPSKRRKRGNKIAEADFEHERLQEVIEEVNGLADTADTTSGAELDENVEVMQDKHVHFSSDDIYMDKTAVIHSTPHLRKMAIKRRTTTSPVLCETGSDMVGRRLKRTSIRHSVPLELSQDGAVRMILEEREYAPLNEVLEERVQQLVAKHAAGNSNMEVPDPEMLVLASQEQITYPQLPDTANSSFQSLMIEEGRSHDYDLVLQSSQIRSQEEITKNERENLKDKIVALSRAAADATYKLECFEIEIQGLGFGQHGDGTDVVLESIRESFGLVRESLQDVVPGTALNDASNGTLLEHLGIKLRDFSARLKTQDVELVEQRTLVADLEKQVNGLIDHLAEAQIEQEKLNSQWNSLDEENEKKDREIEGLQAEIDETANERDAFQDELEAKEQEAEDLAAENTEQLKSIDRLTASLQNYREEEKRLTDMIAKMEEEHQTGVSKMNHERENVVRDLENRLDEQTQLRAIAEDEGEHLQATISSLELQIQESEVTLKAARNELASVTAQRDEEAEGRESAEADLEERSQEVTGLEERVTQLENDLEKLHTQAKDLRQINELERSEKEAVKNDLADRDEEIEKLTEKLSLQGVQANELRQKLFEVQQQKEQTIKELEQAALERDERYQADIAEEIDRRETADNLAQERATAIEELERRIEEEEQETRHFLAKRDERVKFLEQEVVERDREIETLRLDLEQAQAQYEATIEEATDKRDDLEHSVAALKATITEREEDIVSLRKEAAVLVENHNAEVEDRNAHIAELNHSVADLNARVADLTREKDGLERRVEQEAEQMLAFQNETQEELEALKATIRDKQEKILNVEDKAIEADRRWQEVCDARAEEIVELRTANEEQAETITTWKSNFETLQRTFRSYVQEDKNIVADHTEQMAAVLARYEQTELEKLKEGEKALRWADSVGSDVYAQSTTSVVKPQEEVIQKKMRGRKKRVVDSGIGMDGSMLAE